MSLRERVIRMLSRRRAKRRKKKRARINRLEVKVAHACGSIVPTAFYNIGVGRKTEASTMRKRFPNIHLHGCEPLPKVFNNLLNRGIWTTPNATLHNVAIAKEPKMKLYECLSNDMQSSGIEGYRTNVVAVLVDAITLDEFDETAGKPDRIILWMDIEGFELIALETGHSLLSSGRVIAINLEERIPREQKLQSLLSEYGYKTHLEYNHQYINTKRNSGHLDVIYKKP